MRIVAIFLGSLLFPWGVFASTPAAVVNLPEGWFAKNIQLHNNHLRLHLTGDGKTLFPAGHWLLSSTDERAMIYQHQINTLNRVLTPRLKRRGGIQMWVTLPPHLTSTSLTLTFEPEQ